MQPATIGPYKIERELGRGGMGVVYLATDTKLERQIAIKALPADLAADADRLARFQREAKVLASLNHPSVGAIFGLEQADGQQYLVLEFVEGETLAARLERGPVAIDEALQLAKQIAEALEAAHEKGIIHRDLKPGNVMVTPDGAAKVLDFGLARTAEGSPATSTAAMANSPTVTSPVRHSPTTPGVIMGTAGYMSPEQARGKPVDKRSDIFSFGCVLYEMLTGAGPFPGETVTDSLGAILHREPNWALLPPSTPARVRELLTSCLTKDRKNRLHDIGDARLDLERAISGREWSPTRNGEPIRMKPLHLGLVAAGGAAIFAAGWFLSRRIDQPPPATAHSFHVSTAIPDKPEFGSVVGIAPDASFVLYWAWPELGADSTKPGGILIVRRLDRDETKLIEGTEGVRGAAMSPDGRWIAFAASKDRSDTKVTLKKLALEDGTPIGTPETLCDLPAGGRFNLCWSTDREVVVAMEWTQTILAVSAAGGEPRVVIQEEQSKEVDNWGELRPLVPGKSILASRWSLVGQTIKERTEVVDLATGRRTPLLPNAGGAQLIDGGYIVARRNLSTLIAAKVDLSTLQVIGEPVTVWSGRPLDTFVVSDNGTLATSAASFDTSDRKLAWIDERGLPQPTAAPPRAYGSIVMSPDGNRIAVSLESADRAELPSDLWIYDLSRRTFNRIATQGASWRFCWSRDGQRIAYSSVTQEAFAVWNRLADGSGEAVKMYTAPNAQVMVLPTRWSPDGNVLGVLQVDLANQTSDVLLLEKAAGSEEWTARPYLASPASEDGLQFSPDGKWVSFASNESGRFELYLQRFSSAGAGADDAMRGRWQISNSGIRGMAWWRPDGKEVRFVDGDDNVMSVTVTTEPAVSASEPTVLYSIKQLNTWDQTWSPDGRLLVVQRGENERTSRIELVVNFMDEVRRRMSRAE